MLFFKVKLNAKVLIWEIYVQYKNGIILSFALPVLKYYIALLLAEKLLRMTSPGGVLQFVDVIWRSSKGAGRVQLS